MKKLIKHARYLYLLMGVVVVIFLTQCGINPFTVQMPPSGKAGEITTFILKGSTEARVENPPYSTRLLIGIMVPKSWKAKQNATVKSLSSAFGDDVMVLIPDGEIETYSSQPWATEVKRKLGVGPNLIDDFEWIMYRSSKVFNFLNYDDITFDVQVACKLGPENMLVKLGFYMGSSQNGLNFNDTNFTKTLFTGEFEVTDGVGDLIDFVNPQLSKIEPIKSQDNDIVTFTFDAGVTNTILDANENLYLCAKAFDANDNVVEEVCEQTAKTKLTVLPGKKFRLDLWPRAFFNLGPNVSISRIEYYYTDVTGTRKVGYGNTADPFKFTFVCQ